MTMQTRPLGNTEIQVSTLGLGSWNTFGKLVKEEAKVNKIVHAAFDSGINLFDMADSYAGGQAETLLGKAFQTLPRDSIVISSKTFFPILDDESDRGLSRKRILTKIEDSLRRLNTDHLDIYFCHRYDVNTPLEETMITMNDLIQQGKIRYWGTSEWSSDKIHQAQKLAKKNGLIPPAVEQPELNLLTQLKYKQDTYPAASKYNLGMVTFSPLASGLLTGKYDEGIPAGTRLDKVDHVRKRFYKDEIRQKTRTLTTIANELNCSRAQLSIAWTMAQPGVSSVITGASKLEQLQDNLGAINISLNREIINKLDKVFAPSFARIIKYKLRQKIRNLKS